jgi:hypothetical protein
MTNLVDNINSEAQDYGPIEYKGMTLELQADKYRNGAIKLEMYHSKTSVDELTGNLLGREGDLYSTLTLNLPEVELGEEDILVRSFGHDHELYEAVLDHFDGVFEDTGEHHQSEIHDEFIGNVWKFYT